MGFPRLQLASAASAALCSTGNCGQQSNFQREEGMRFAAILGEPALQARQGITVRPGKIARSEAAGTTGFGDAPALFGSEVTTDASFVFHGARCILSSRRAPDAPPLPLTMNLKGQDYTFRHGCPGL